MLSALVGLIGAALLAVIGWAINMQSRVSVLEADKEAAEKREDGLKELVDVKLESILVMVRSCNTRLDRIEKKMDKEE